MVNEDALREFVIHYTNALTLLATLDEKIKTILNTEPLCTGTAYYREDDKLYANHGGVCPLHGKHPTGNRLRVYVGNDPAKCDLTLKAMAAHSRLLQLRQRREHLADVLQNIGRNINALTAMLRNAVRHAGRAGSAGRDE